MCPFTINRTLPEYALMIIFIFHWLPNKVNWSRLRERNHTFFQLKYSPLYFDAVINVLLNVILYGFSFMCSLSFLRNRSIKSYELITCKRTSSVTGLVCLPRQISAWFYKKLSRLRRREELVEMNSNESLCH